MQRNRYLSSFVSGAGVLAITKGLCSRALQKAAKTLAEDMMDAPGAAHGTGEAGAIKALVDAVSKQQATVKIELGLRIKVRPPAACKHLSPAFANATGHQVGGPTAVMLPVGRSIE